jgi:hypothetical protein
VYGKIDTNYPYAHIFYLYTYYMCTYIYVYGTHIHALHLYIHITLTHTHKHTHRYIHTCASIGAGVWWMGERGGTLVFVASAWPTTAARSAMELLSLASGAAFSSSITTSTNLKASSSRTKEITSPTLRKADVCNAFPLMLMSLCDFSSVVIRATSTP